MTRALSPDADRQIQHRAREILQKHPHFHGHSDWVHCRCRRGCLRLEGKLPSWYLKQLAQEAVQGLNGVQRLSNRIKVASPSGHVQPS
jgi:osmotically-inducible protein OsmY